MKAGVGSREAVPPHPRMAVAGELLLQLLHSPREVVAPPVLLAHRLHRALQVLDGKVLEEHVFVRRGAHGGHVQAGRTEGEQVPQLLPRDVEPIALREHVVDGHDGGVDVAAERRSRHRQADALGGGKKWLHGGGSFGIESDSTEGGGELLGQHDRLWMKVPDPHAETGLGVGRVGAVKVVEPSLSHEVVEGRRWSSFIGMGGEGDEGCLEFVVQDHPLAHVQATRA